MDLTNEDVADILALLDSLPYDELDLQTSRFRLVLRRTPDGWTQSAETRSAPAVLSAPGAPGTTTSLPQRGRQDDMVATTTRSDVGAGEMPVVSGAVEATDGDARGLVAVRAPLPGTFYRAPRPGAAPFVEVGSQVGPDTVVGIVETMKLMNSVTAGTAGMVAEICLGNAEFAAHGATLLRIRAD
jgi:acetyl-CoA carboxylase biotin carboxyl carrier protein